MIDLTRRHNAKLQYLEKFIGIQKKKTIQNDTSLILNLKMTLSFQKI